MKLKMINAAALILQFDQECSRLYSKLREKYIFTRDNIAIVYKYNNSTHIDIKSLNDNREEVDGDKFICVEEFNFENITVYITYGDENLAMSISVSIDKEDNQYFIDFYDIFNFLQINELRKTSFLDVSNEQDIVRIISRFEEFLHLYLEIIMDLSIDENNLKQFIEFLEQKYKKITFMQAWHTSRGDSHFEKGNYKKAAITYSKVLPVLSHIQTQKYQHSIKAIFHKHREIELLKKFELEQDLYYFKKIKIIIINDSIWIGIFFLLWPIFTGIFFLLFYTIYYVYFNLINEVELIYFLKPHVGYCTIPAMFVGMLATFYPAYIIMKKIRRKKFRDYIATKKSSESRLTVPSGIGLGLLLVGITLMVVLGFHWTIKFTDYAIYDGTKFFSMSEERYEYQEIEGMYKVRHDINNPKIETEYYVIKYKNGKISNLNNFSDLNDKIKNEILPILIKKGVKIETVDYLITD